MHAAALHRRKLLEAVEARQGINLLVWLVVLIVVLIVGGPQLAPFQMAPHRGRAGERQLTEWAGLVEPDLSDGTPLLVPPENPVEVAHGLLAAVEGLAADRTVQLRKTLGLVLLHLLPVRELHAAILAGDSLPIFPGLQKFPSGNL